MTVLGSSSQGNCYILQNDTEALILEAGIKFSAVKQALGYNLRKVAGCLVTHQHGDHAKFLREMLWSCIRVYALPDVFKAKGCLGERRAMAITPLQGFSAGRFDVMPIPAIHNVPCVGWVITHPEIGRLMFLTDTMDCGYKINGLSHIMIECNFSMPLLVKAVEEGRTPSFQLRDLPERHLELQNCRALLADTDLSKVSEIVLLHLSAENSDAPTFKREVERSTGRVVHIATPGLELELSRL